MLHKLKQFKSLSKGDHLRDVTASEKMLSFIMPCGTRFFSILKVLSMSRSLVMQVCIGGYCVY